MARGITTPHRLDVAVGVTGGGAVAYWNIKETLKLAGWVVESSGDGVSAYSATGDILTSSNSGANGMSNVLAWYVIRQPAAVAGQTRRFCIQVITLSNTNQFRIKYTLNEAFSTGTPSATQVPSATTQQILLGGGTSGAPTGIRAWSDGSGGTHRCYGIADGAAPYGFIFAHTRTDSNTDTQEGRFGLDPVHVPEDIDHSADIDPYVIHIGSAASWQVVSLSALSVSNGAVEPGIGRDAAGTYSRFCLLDMQNGGGTTNIAIPDNSTTTGNAAASPQDQWSAREALVPLAYANVTSGLKGVSTLIHGICTDDANVLATRFRLYNNGSESNAYIRVGAYAIPWSGGSAPGSGAWNSYDADIWYFGETPPEAPVAVDTTPPAITNLTPASGEVRASSVIGFDVTDETALAAVAIFVSYPDGSCEVIHDGFAFRGNYQSEANTRTVITDGYRYTVRRDGGWMQSPTIEWVALDATGNAGVIT